MKGKNVTAGMVVRCRTTPSISAYWRHRPEYAIIKGAADGNSFLTRGDILVCQRIDTTGRSRKTIWKRRAQDGTMSTSVYAFTQHQSLELHQAAPRDRQLEIDDVKREIKTLQASRKTALKGVREAETRIKDLESTLKGLTAFETNEDELRHYLLLHHGDVATETILSVISAGEADRLLLEYRKKNEDLLPS